MMLLKIILLLMVTFSYFKTEKPLPVAGVWGVLSLFFHGSNDWIVMIFFGVISFLIAWGVFSLAEYFEDSVLLRLMVLSFGMVAMLVV